MCCVYPSVVVKTWLLFPQQWEKMTPVWLVVRTGLDNSEETVFQGLILQTRILFRSALVPAQCAFWMFQLWRQLDDVLAGSEASHWVEHSSLWASWVGPCQRPSSGAACALPGETWYVLQSNLSIGATALGLELPRKIKSRTEASCH